MDKRDKELEDYLASFKLKEAPETLRARVLAKAKSAWTQEAPRPARPRLSPYRSVVRYALAIAAVFLLNILSGVIDQMLTSAALNGRRETLQASASKRREKELEEWRELCAEIGMERVPFRLWVRHVQQTKPRRSLLYLKYRLRLDELTEDI